MANQRSSRHRLDSVSDALARVTDELSSTAPRPALLALFDEEDELPTAVAAFDLAAYARAMAPDADEAGDGDPRSGIRRSFPTLTEEAGALPNEPEEDAILRWLGGGDRELRMRVTAAEIRRYPLAPIHGYLLGLIDGVTSIADVLDISTLPAVYTLRALEEMVTLGVVG